MWEFVAKNVTLVGMCHFLQFWWIWIFELFLRRRSLNFYHGGFHESFNTKA
jgi:hypothetical protein